MKRLISLSINLALIFIFANIALAHHPETPDNIDGVENVSAEEVYALIDNKNVYVIDSRKAWHYVTGHIKNALSLPYNFTTLGAVPEREGKFDLSKLPQDKNTTIIFYDDGKHGWHSFNSAKQASENGYNNVKWFRTGYEEWSKKGYPTESYKEADR